MSGPLSAVLAEVGAGVGSIAEMSRRTGYSAEVLRASVDHLVRSGRLAAQSLPFGCPPEGCGGCASSGCGTSGGRTVLTVLRRTA